MAEEPAERIEFPLATMAAIRRFRSPCSTVSKCFTIRSVTVWAALSIGRAARRLATFLIPVVSHKRYDQSLRSFGTARLHFETCVKSSSRGIVISLPGRGDRSSLGPSFLKVYSDYRPV